MAVANRSARYILLFSHSIYFCAAFTLKENIITPFRHPDLMKKILIVYYSFEGNTEFIAEAIASEIGADIERLKPVKDLKSKGFSKFVWGGRQVAMKKKPELEPLDKNPDDYDVLIIGTPVWASTFTPAIRSFLASYPLKGKKIALFCTHQGGPKNTLDNLEAALEGNTIIGRLDLPHVLKRGPEQKKADAIKWARGIL